jgi:ubiquinone/menaquinone biosynthesis C-methylase UbiE
MKTVFEETYKKWGKVYSFFWGDIFDFRFLVANELNKINSKKVLDIGCSVGITVNSTNSNVRVGIDIDLNSLIKGKKVFPKTEFIAASADSLPFKKNSFDFIISVHTLDTDPLDSEIAINEISEVLESQGKIFLTGNWFEDKYISKFTSKTKISGSWIKKLKKCFDVETRWYVRPNLKKLNIRIKRKLIFKFPKLILKNSNMDKWFYKNYKISNLPLKMEPYIVQGIKK